MNEAEMKVTKNVPARVMVYSATVAVALLSGCSGGKSGSNTTTTTAQSGTFTRDFVPLNDGDKITYLTTKGDGIGLAPFQVAAVVRGPAQTISDVPVPMMSVTYGYISDSVPSLTEYQTTTDTGFADYGTDYFVDTAESPQGTPTLPGSIRPLPQTGVASAVVQTTEHYPQSREIPFGLAAGASTPLLSIDSIVIYPDNSAPERRQSSTATYQFTNQGRETVTVPMGTFSCVKIKAQYDGFIINTSWYAEKVGLVKRFEQRTYSGTVDHEYDITYEAVSASIGDKQYP